MWNRRIHCSLYQNYLSVTRCCWAHHARYVDISVLFSDMKADGCASVAFRPIFLDSSISLFSFSRPSKRTWNYYSFFVIFLPNFIWFFFFAVIRRSFVDICYLNFIVCRNYLMYLRLTVWKLKVPFIINCFFCGKHPWVIARASYIRKKKKKKLV